MTVDSTLPAGVADVKGLRRAFGMFATGVTVLTVGGSHAHGMTANSFTAVSLDPPLVAVCIDRTANMHQALTASEAFGVSVLGAHQEAVGRHFADRLRPRGMAQFEGVDWSAGRLTGTPLIGDALAHFECEVWRTYDGGDHTIVVGSVLALDRQPGHEALLFFQGRFDSTSPRTEVIT